MSATIQIANAPCSWGVLEFDELGEPLPYDEVLNQIAHTGYAGTELGDWGFMPTGPAELRDELARRHLTLVGAFVPVALARQEAHTAGIQAAVKAARLLRAKKPVYEPYFTTTVRVTWKRLRKSTN
jgi:inosose dehydratase